MRTRPIRSRTRAAIALGLAFASVLLAPRPVRGASFRLSAGESFSDIARVSEVPFDSVEMPIVTPDGAWVVYTHDAQTDGAFELWAAPVDGGPPHRLSGLLPSGESAFGVSITPDGTRAIYRAAQDETSTDELYSALIAAPAGSFAKINAPLSGGGGTLDLAVSPDSTQIAYSVHDSGFENIELWVAAIDGSTRERVFRIPSGRHLGSSRMTADFSHLVFIADLVVAGRSDLWTIPSTGGTPLKLDGALVSGGNVSGISVSPVGDAVFYIADQQTDGVVEAYVVHAGGGGAVKVNAPLAAGDTIIGGGFLPGAQRVYYAVSHPGGPFDLWTVGPDGGNPVQVSGPLQPNGNVTAIAWSADGKNIVYVADQESDELFELYAVPAAGGTIKKLNPTLVGGGDVSSAVPPVITADGKRVLYVADQEVDERQELWAVPIGGGTPVRISRTLGLTASWQVVGFEPTADSSAVVYTFHSRPTNLDPYTTRLWRAPILGGTSVRLDGATSVAVDMFARIVVSPATPHRAFYIADQDADGQYELYMGDDCIFCDGFEGLFPVRWGGVVP